jgi:hypothetical protein
MAIEESEFERLAAAYKELEKIISINGEKYLDLERKFLEMKQRNFDATHEIISLQTQLNKIKTSRSWRFLLTLSYPIRISKKIFRRLFN